MGEQTLEITLAGLRADMRRLATDSQAAAAQAGEAIRRAATAAIQQEAAARMERIEAMGSQHAVARASVTVMLSAVVLAASAAHTQAMPNAGRLNWRWMTAGRIAESVLFSSTRHSGLAERTGETPGWN